MKNKDVKIERYKRKTVMTNLEPFDHLAKDYDFIEISQWYNGEGFDVEISTSNSQRFQLTWGEYDALKYLIKRMYNKDEKEA